MDHVRLGRTGVKVSRLCLGCMSFGDPTRGHHAWTLGEDDSRAIIARALDHGINFVDTANMYGLGASEEVLGNVLWGMSRREDIVLATKVYNRMRPGPNGAGLSRKVIFHEIDQSLTRLKADHVDLYQIHRWDYETPIEETLEALNDVVRAGKARYIGASSMWAWQFAKALAVSDANGWARFVSMQDFLNLIYREEEREMLPLCRDQGIGVLPWSPLARGRLARDPEAQTKRTETDALARTLMDGTADADRAIIDKVGEIAAARGVPRAQVAMAWVLQVPGVTAPIVGATKPSHLDDAVAALSLTLEAEEIAALEAPYVPHPVAGHS